MQLKYKRQITFKTNKSLLCLINQYICSFQIQSCQYLRFDFKISLKGKNARNLKVTDNETFHGALNKRL